VVITYDGSGDATGVKFYIDGIEDTTTQTLSNNLSVSIPNAPSEHFMIGETPKYGGTNWMDGEMSNLQIWDVKLEDAEVLTLYNDGIPLLIGTQPQAANLEAWYKLDQSANWEADTVGNWQIPDNRSAYPQSFDFNGTNNWINCGTDSSTDLTTQMTISAWMKTGTTDTTTTIGPILFKDSTGGVARSYSMGWRPLSAGHDKMYVAVFHTNGNATSLYTSTAGALSDGNWHHVMGTYDGTDGTDALKIYVDGVLDNTATPTPGDTGIRVSATTNLAIGSLSHGASWWYGGGLSNVQLWDIALDAQIETLYNNGTPLTTANSFRCTNRNSLQQRNSTNNSNTKC